MAGQILKRAWPFFLAGATALAAPEADRLEEFLKFQASITRVLQEVDGVFVKGDPAREETEEQWIRLEKFRDRLEAMKKRNREWLGSKKGLREAVDGRGLVFDGSRWATRQETCERIGLLSSAIEHLQLRQKYLGQRLDAMEAVFVREKNRKKDQENINSWSRQATDPLPEPLPPPGAPSGAKGAGGVPGTGDPFAGIPAFTPHRKEPESPPSDGSAELLASQRSALKELRKKRKKVQDYEVVLRSELAKALAIDGIEENLETEGFLEVEGKWVKV